VDDGRETTQRPTTFEIPLALLRRPTQGKAYDLSSGWWPGMPLANGHPPFQVLTYRSPAGQRNQRDLRFLDHNPTNFGFISELVMGTTHTGTHIDALCHITCGPDSCWHGGYSARDFLGDFGPLKSDASELPPLIKRGLMLDIPAARGMKRLPQAEPVGAADLEAACRRQGVTVQEGDFVLIRTGTMLGWPDEEALAASEGSGLSLDGAQWLAERKIAAVGGDNAALEVNPSGVPDEFQPVHRFLIQERGLLILEWVNPEELARDGVSEFLFVCLPLPVRGATGSMVRPLAIV
jgi:kynurenine formamidase